MEREIFIDNLLVRAHLIIEMSRPALRHGSLNSLFPVAYYVPSHTYGVRVGMATLFCGSIMWDGEVSAYLGRNQNLKDIKAPPPTRRCLLPRTSHLPPRSTLHHTTHNSCLSHGPVQQHWRLSTVHHVVVRERFHEGADSQRR